MSDSGLSRLSVGTEQAYIGSLVESTIIQSLFTGFYALLFFQTIAPLVQQKKWNIITALTSLFIAVVLNLAAVWDILYEAVVIHDETRASIAGDVLAASPSFKQKMAYGTLALSVLMADTFLIWKSYVMWEKNKIIAILYSVVCVVELAALPVFLARNINLGSHLGFLDLYLAVSFVSTIIATVLIIYKIIDVSKQGNNELSRYQYTIKVLVESGMLYIGIIVACSILHLLAIFGINSPAVIHATQDFDAILVPVTGIAPTLITARNVVARGNQSGRESDVEANHPASGFIVSRLAFRRHESDAEFPIPDDENTTGNSASGKDIHTRTV